MEKTYLDKYTRYRELVNFKVRPLEKRGACIYFEGELVQDNVNKKKYAEGEHFVNASFGFYKSVAGVLSNLFPMEFVFRGKKVSSIEGVLQGIKYNDVAVQNEVLKYSGMTAYAAGRAYDWTKKQILFWQGSPMRRDSKEYQVFLDELYLSALENPLYKTALLSTGNKTLIHHIGKVNITETVLTREEYEIRLNTLREFARLYRLTARKECEMLL